MTKKLKMLRNCYKLLYKILQSVLYYNGIINKRPDQGIYFIYYSAFQLTDKVLS